MTAKKGFQVYYTTNGTFRLKKKISGSNNTCVISGGSLTLSSSDDGITYSADRDDNFPLNTASASVSDYKDTEADILFFSKAHSTHIHPH